MLSGIHTGKEAIEAGFPRESLEIWHKAGCSCVIELEPEQYFYLQEHMLRDARRHLHFCKVGENFATAIPPSTFLLLKLIFGRDTGSLQEALILSATMTPAQYKEYLDAKTSGLQ